MAARKVCFVTGNEEKAAEVSQILGRSGIEIEQVSLDLDEIQDRDVEKVAVDKARKAFEILKRPLITEDTGLIIKSMNDYPGTLIKYFYYAIGLRGIVDFLKGKDRSASAETVFVYADEKGIKTFRGIVKGKISENVSPVKAFVWDPIFIPEGYSVTFADMGTEEKNRISHRKLALDKLAEFLKNL